MPHTIEAGKVAFVVANAGRILHGFDVDGQGIEGKVLPRQTKTLILKPGKYKAYRPVDGHKDLGMEVDLTVMG